jgi:ornithine decarboxylase
MYNSERVITDFINKSDLKKIKEFSKDKKTPFLIMDLNKIDKKYDELKKNLPFAEIYYAVKANPQDKIIKLLAKKGSCFDIATIYELDQLLNKNFS